MHGLPPQVQKQVAHSGALKDVRSSVGEDMSLYELTNEQRDILWELEENGGELSPELEARLDLTSTTLQPEAESRVRWLRSIAANIDAMGSEIAKLQARKKSLTKLETRLKDGLRDAMRAFGKTALMLTITRLSLCRIAKRGIKPVLPIDKLPAELRKTKEVFDSEAAREIFEKTGAVPSCEIGPEYYVRGL